MTKPTKRKLIKPSEYFARWGGRLSFDEQFELDTASRDCHLYDISEPFKCNYRDLTTECSEDDRYLLESKVRLIH